MTPEEQELSHDAHMTGDPTSQRIYADWLEDHGRADIAAAYRYAANRGLRPALTPVRLWASWHRGGGHADSRLSATVWAALRGHDKAIRTARRYRTAAAAYAALADALSRLKVELE